MKLTLPETCCHLTYSAFRAGFVTVLETLLSDALESSDQRCVRPGLFDSFPLLNAVAPQVQLECLLRTWNHCRFGIPEHPEVLDECVLHAAYDCLARVAADDSRTRLRAVLNGPCEVSVDDDHWLMSRTRCLQIAGPRPHSRAFFREFEELDHPSPWPGLDTLVAETNRDELLELVGRWAADPELVLRSESLLTEPEQSLLQAFFEEHPGLLRS